MGMVEVLRPMGLRDPEAHGAVEVLRPMGLRDPEAHGDGGGPEAHGIEGP